MTDHEIIAASMNMSATAIKLACESIEVHAAGSQRLTRSLHILREVSDELYKFSDMLSKSTATPIKKA